ncbi:oligosaccharide flippase family protein [Oceaniovalibus sp. ACAM 378]|uniref:oligosaccharide flippase family protein n=1 Tax=Oceaniovalibus sp. ACAM 378 TaxID=2599923 RepID=UPI0011DB259E|nr:oligosaccharide flippase family protein [Oceaniovalibus sp. ACAM 378]TYB85042.1 oligosaccharide flippase family protein [Oceaniovalibus sp. ACAM 378]
MSSIRSAVLYSTAGKYATTVIGLATTAVVARLISPHEYGIAVLGMATLAVANAVRELGSTAYLVQVEELTEDRLRGVFTINLCISVALALVVALGAPLIANLFGQPGLALFLHISLVGFLTGSVAFPLYGLLSRDLAYRKLSAVAICSAIVNSAALIIFAALEFSFQSFALANVISGLTGALLLFWLKPARAMFRPGFAAWRDILSFSLFTGGASLLHRASDYLAVAVLGVVLTPGAVGLLNRATQICQFPERTILAGVTEVALPAFSDLARRKQDLAATYLGAIEKLTVFMWPCLALTILLAHPLVRGFLGSDWLEVIPLVQIIAGALILNFPPGLNYPLIVAMGKTRRLFVLAILQISIALPIVLIAAQLGMFAVAWSTYLIVLAGVITSTVAVRGLIDIPLSSLFASMYRSLGVTAVSILPATGLVMLLGGPVSLGAADSLAVLGTAALGWLAGIVALSHPIRTEIKSLFAGLQRRLRRIRVGSHPEAPKSD